MNATLNIIYEDDDIIVCHKPAGIATEGAGVGKMDLVSSIRNYLARKNRAAARNGKPPYVGTLYRLDQPVEGVVVVAKNKSAASFIAKQIKERTTEKYYYALCYGKIANDSGHLEDLLVRKQSDGLALVVSVKEANSLLDQTITLGMGQRQRIFSGEIKEAVLDYEVMQRDENSSLVKIKLRTGRFHQIRVQFAHMGHPLLGDLKYGTKESIAYSEAIGKTNVCLACCRFGFVHPSSKKKVFFEITIPQSLKL
ncbi:MAG: RluA family pseudouridine synthase [Butyrivibrio sp.]|nr:RluA family pseudouridine synthase [Butyrivibrio sp.]